MGLIQGQEMSDQVLSLNVQGSRKLIVASDKTQLLYLLLDVHPPADIKAARLPLNLCLVIDRSTSMRGDRIERVKNAAALVVEKLGSQDIISVIAFSDRAEVILPASHVQDRHRLVAHVRGIITSGGTEIYQGLLAGVGELRKVALDRRVNHIILLTDGQTYGDAENCLQLAHKAAKDGIGLSAFGIGTDWNDRFLDQLVAPSGGQSAYIETATQVVELLQQRIQGLGAIYASNLRLGTEFPVGLNLISGFKVAPFAQPLANEEFQLKLGHVEAQSPLLALLEVAVDPQLPGRTIQIPLRVRADIPSQQLVDYRLQRDFSLSVVAEEPAFNPPQILVDAVRALNLYRMNEKVWSDVEVGNIDQATTRMRRLTTRLLEAGQTDLARQAQMEAERLASIGTLSLAGRKGLKYGTRSLLTQTINLEE
jgi:Ca-activated chloride channel homolog